MHRARGNPLAHRKRGSGGERALAAAGPFFIVASQGPGMYSFDVKVIIQLSETEEVRALPILLRHSPGMVLPGRKYVLSSEALGALRKARIRFVEISRETSAPALEEVAGERV